jgi:NADH dehydrogenase
MSEKKKIIIIGGGFAGIQLVKKLDKKLFDILLIDKQNHHQFQPLFYQVAASQIEPSSISFPFRYVFKKDRSVQIRLAEVTRILPEENKIETNIGSFDYDYLVIASGCKTNFYGNQDLEQHAFTLKTTYDAITVRNHVQLTFEKMLSAKEEEKESLMNIVIVGAGPTGVELSGAFSEIKKYVLPRDYPGIDFSKLKIWLIEGGPHPLGSMSEGAKIASEKYLKKMGVTVVTGTIVKNFDGKKAILSDGKNIPTSTLIWTAGIAGNFIEGLPDQVRTTGNRIIVNRNNLIAGFPNLYALGDVALMTTPKYPNGHPQVANVAINQATLLAKNLKKIMQNQELKDYEYRDLGSMATVGKNKAVVDFPKLHFKGFLAWLIWIFLHLMLILSVRSKIIIFINWVWNYLSYDSSLGLILKQNPSKSDEA